MCTYDPFSQRNVSQRGHKWDPSGCCLVVFVSLCGALKVCRLNVSPGFTPPPSLILFGSFAFWESPKGMSSP